MAKRQFELTETQINELTAAYSQCKDGATRTRYQAVRLYGTGYVAAEIEAITGCSRSSLMVWCRVYLHHGTAGLMDKRAGGNCAKLTHAQIVDLEQHLHNYTPRDVLGSHSATTTGQFWTVEDVSQVLSQRYGVAYRSRTSILSLLQQCGFSYQRPAKVFKSRREAQVIEFEEQLEKN